MPGFTVFAQFRVNQISDWDKKYVSEVGKISSLTYEKLADHDRIPLTIYYKFAWTIERLKKQYVDS